MNRPQRATVRSGRAAPRLLLLVLVLAALAAGAYFLLRPPAPEPTRHLWPVLRSTGLPSVERAAEVRVVHEIRFREGLSGWAPYRAAIQSVEEALAGAENVRGLAGFVVRPEDERVDLSPPQIRGETIQWEADSINALVIRASFEIAGVARIYFRTRAEEERQLEAQRERLEAGLPPILNYPAQNHVDVPTRQSPGLQDWSFEVGRHPAWTGTITALRLDLVQGHHSFVLDRLAAVDRDLVVGSSPTTLTTPEGERLLDAGLVTLAVDEEQDPLGARYEARRAHPALAGDELYVHTELPEDATLRYSFGLPPDADRLQGPVTFSVSLAYRGVPEDPRALATSWPGPEAFAEYSQRILLDPAADAGRWHAGRMRVPAASGPVLVVLRAEGGAPDGRVNGLWGPLTLFPEEARPLTSVVLVTADTLRADHVSCYGSEVVSTPVIDALAARGATFLDVLAQCNATSPSHATILTGLYPKDHGVLGNNTLLSEDVRTLGEIMRRSGRVTLASSSVRHLNSNLSGMGQGIDVYFDTPPLIPGPPDPRYRDLPPWVRRPQPPNVREAYRDADAVHAQLFPVLDELGDQPFFLWLHYYDPHTPYRAEPEIEAQYWEGEAPVEGEPLLAQFAKERVERNPHLRGFLHPDDGQPRAYGPDEVRLNYLADHPHLAFLGDASSADYPRALYRAGVAQLDRDFGLLLDHLGPRLEDTLVVFTSDHGEALGERDIWFDHQGVYDNTLRIPLIFAGPGVPADVRVPDPVESVDVLLSLCELLDLPPPPVARGLSLVPLMEGERQGERRRWFQHAGNLEAGYQDGRTHVFTALIDHPRGTFDQPIPRGHVEFYDRSQDPRLERDLGPSAPGAPAAVAEVEAWLEERAVDVEARASDIDQATLEQLGYFGHGAPAEGGQRR